MITKITSFNIQRNVASSKLIFSRSALEADSALKQGSTTSFEASNSAKSLGAIVKRSHPASARISPLFLKVKVRNHSTNIQTNFPTQIYPYRLANVGKYPHIYTV